MRTNPLFIFGPNLLTDGVKACQAVSVKPFLIYGTLLGFVRENDFIADDHDIDLGLLDEDFRKKHLIKDALLKKGYKYRTDDDYLISFFHPKHPSLFLDFSCVYKKDDHMVIATFSNDPKKTLLSYRFPLEAMSEFREIRFYNNDILIPSDPRIFLSAAYGQWQKPKKGNVYEVF